MLDDLYRTKDNILIVDDEPNNLKVLYNLLIDNDYDVQAARDGRTALQAAQETPPDLILLDIKMPEMDGYEVCEHLKADERTREIPVIFISALNQTEDIVKAFTIGGVDYITKPFQFEEVRARVNTHLTIKHQREHVMMQQKQIEAMRQRDRELFDKLTDMREQFVRSAAHDLKSPLSLIGGYASLMTKFEEVRSNPQIMECVDEISASCDEMLHLITSMLDYIRLQAAIGPSFTAVDLVSLAEQELQKYQKQANQRDIKIEPVVENEELLVNVDPKLIARVIDNLLSNAIKYSPDSTTVTVKIEQDKHSAALHITDQGSGIPEYDLQTIFQPFYRTSEASKSNISGTGLGLSIVKEIVEQHYGRVQVESAIGKGSTFSFYLPLHEQKAVPTQA
jgi:signal transduction histidine kinase